MKALFVHDHWFSVTSSGEIFSNGKLAYYTWLRYLSEFDEIVVVGRSRLATEAEAALMNLSSGDRVSFVFVPNLAGPWRFIRHRSEVVRTLSRQIRNADAVIARTSLLGELAAFLARQMRKPCAVEVVGDPWDACWNYGSIMGKMYAPIAWWSTRRCLGKADFAIYVTREYLQRRYPCRGLCGHASDVEISLVDKAVLDRKVVRWSSAPLSTCKKTKIGLIGSLENRYKGLHVALRALRRLREQGISLELLVLGHGKLDQWRQEAKLLGVDDLLYLPGILPSGEPVMQWLDGLDIYIQPSFQEGLPRALIEAMSRGLPALGSTCGGIPELLPSECLHLPGDDRTLAEQIAHMIRDPSWLISHSIRNFHEARNYYHDKVSAQRSVFWGQFAEAARRTEGLER